MDLSNAGQRKCGVFFFASWAGCTVRKASLFLYSSLCVFVILCCGYHRIHHAVDGGWLQLRPCLSDGMLEVESCFIQFGRVLVRKLPERFFFPAFSLVFLIDLKTIEKEYCDAIFGRGVVGGFIEGIRGFIFCEIGAVGFFWKIGLCMKEKTRLLKIHLKTTFVPHVSVQFLLEFWNMVVNRDFRLLYFQESAWLLVCSCFIKAKCYPKLNMSHTMTVRTTRTTTSTSFIVLNTGHFRTAQGLLKLAETVSDSLAELYLDYF